MAGVIAIIGLVCSLVSLVCAVIILIDAFKAEVLQGILCLCVPFYILYYAFAKFEHEKKGLIIAGWLGCAILNGVLQVAAAAAAGGMQ